MALAGGPPDLLACPPEGGRIGDGGRTRHPARPARHARAPRRAPRSGPLRRDAGRGGLSVPRLASADRPRRDPCPDPRRPGTARGQCVAFAQVWNASEAAIGSTRFLDIRPKDRQVEIGSTFLARAYWRTPANTEAKYLLLRHCFESAGCVRVALKTDGRNARSQAAIERLGAVREGVLRKHMNVRGYQRDTVYYSILDTEWPAVKARLEARLAASA